VVRRQALPSTKTDLYSMAVLFFYMIFNWHPLDASSTLLTVLVIPAIYVVLRDADQVLR
jgi:hypothetical protein